MRAWVVSSSLAARLHPMKPAPPVIRTVRTLPSPIFGVLSNLRRRAQIAQARALLPLPYPLRAGVPAMSPTRQIPRHARPSGRIPELHGLAIYPRSSDEYLPL